MPFSSTGVTTRIATAHLVTEGQFMFDFLKPLSMTSMKFQVLESKMPILPTHILNHCSLIHVWSMWSSFFLAFFFLSANGAEGSFFPPLAAFPMPTASTGDRFSCFTKATNLQSQTAAEFPMTTRNRAKQWIHKPLVTFTHQSKLRLYVVWNMFMYIKWSDGQRRSMKVSHNYHP